MPGSTAPSATAAPAASTDDAAAAGAGAGAGAAAASRRKRGAKKGHKDVAVDGAAIAALAARVESACVGLDELRARVGGAALRRCARGYAGAIAGTTTWYATGKRHVHEPQLEAIVGELSHHTEGVASLVELGAGKGLLGRILQEVTQKPLLVVERRGCTHYDAEEATRVTTDLADVALDEVIPDNSLVLAKHFCGAASDAAVASAVASRKVSVAAIAPCCHPQIEWDSYAGRGYLEGLGFSREDFAVFLEFIFMSRHKGGAMPESSCSQWRELRTLPGDVLYATGRRCRRLVEEGRMRALRAGGFSRVELVAYATEATTPDNYLIVGHRGRAETLYSFPSARVSQTVVPVAQGILLHVVCDVKTACARIAQYLLERRAADLAACGGSAIETVQLCNLVHGGLVLVVEGNPIRLLTEVIKTSRLLGSVVDMAVPFTHALPLSQRKVSPEAFTGGAAAPAAPAAKPAAVVDAGVKAEIAAHVHAIMEGGLLAHYGVPKDSAAASSADGAAAAAAAAAAATPAKKARMGAGAEEAEAKGAGKTGVRVTCLPRSLESDPFGTLFAQPDANAEVLFTPIDFSLTLSAVLWEDRMGRRCLLTALVPRTSFSGREWREECQRPLSFVSTRTGEVVTPGKNPRRVIQLLNEVAERYGSCYEVAGHRVLFVVDDAKDGSLEVVREYLLAKGAAAVVIAASAKDRPAEGQAPEAVRHYLKPTPPLEPGVSYTYCLFALDRGDQANVLRRCIPDGMLQVGAPVVGRLKLGAQSRGRAVVEKQNKEWRAQGFKQAVVYHLLSDREIDRTVLSRWSEDMPPAETADTSQ